MCRWELNKRVHGFTLLASESPMSLACHAARERAASERIGDMDLSAHWVVGNWCLSPASFFPTGNHLQDWEENKQAQSFLDSFVK